MKFHFTANLCLFASFLLFLFMPTKNSLAQQGTSCNNPLAFNGNNLFYSGTTCGFGDNAAVGGGIVSLICNGSFIGGEDIIFLFTPSETACYNIEINGDEGASFAMYAACPNNISSPFQIASCLEISGVVGNLGGASPMNGANISLEAGVSYFLIVSSYNGNLGNFPCGEFEMSISIPNGVVNDFCSNALPLSSTGSNYGATDCGEPDDWTPETCSAEWSSNENGVWYTFNNPTQKDVTIDIYNIECQGGGENLQIGIWTNNNTCDLSVETQIGCLVTVGNQSAILSNLPAGDYYIFVDGNAGADCTWNFGGTLICGTPSPIPPTPLILCTDDALPVTLSVTPSNAANTINWYASSNTSTPIATGATISTPAFIDNSIEGTYTLYATETNINGNEICESSPVSIIIEIIDSPDLCNACEQPTNAIVIDITCSSVRLQWDAVPNATAYQIAGRKANGVWKVFGEQTDNYREFTSGVLPNETYEWSVKALCSNGWTDWVIPTMSFTTPVCKNGETSSYDMFSDVQEIKNEISLYPNPAKNIVQLAYMINSFETLRTAKILHLDILDITGKIVAQQKLNANSANNLFSLDISYLEKGQYFVRLQTEKMQLVDKLIVW
ncbi:MAG: T9SS type A sorting domain-containing protein [Chitinophagales bacterium]